MPEYRLSILHISDLHASSSDLDELPPAARESRRRQVELQAAGRAKVLGDAWDKNLRDLYPDGDRPDLICFTGDVADWALASEYAEATKQINRLVALLGVTRSQIYVVPGNHDVRRTDPTRDRVEHKKWTSLREILWSDTRTSSEWLAGSRPPRAINGKVADAVMKRTAAFWRWVENDLARPELLPGRHAHGRLGYHHVASLPHLPFPVHVIGLDSAWLAGDDNDQGKLWLTQHQRDMLLSDRDGKPWSDGFRLALVHHPIEELAQPEREATRRDLAAAAHLLLHGHQHDPVGSSQIDLDGRTLRVLAAGCLYEGTEGSSWKNGCQRIDLTLDEAGQPLRAEIDFRAWSIRGHWYPDSSLYRNLSNGRMTWHAWGGDGHPAHDKATATPGRTGAVSGPEVRPEAEAPVSAPHGDQSQSQDLSEGARDLLARILAAGSRGVIFLCGSALTTQSPGESGVPGVPEVVALLSTALDNGGGASFDTALARAKSTGSGKDYADAYREGFAAFVRRGGGPDAANRLIREAVLQAHEVLDEQRRAKVLAGHPDDHREPCQELLNMLEGWRSLRPSVAALGEILTLAPTKFPLVLTTNFDPLIEVAVRRAGGSVRSTVLPHDGNPAENRGQGTHVVYLHGYWFDSDTLHTEVQLASPRPRLEATLRRWINRSLLVVLGYGGWDDVLMKCLRDVAADVGAHPEIAWAFYRQKDASVVRKLEVAGERVQFYEHVDLHRLLPRLRDRLRGGEDSSRSNNGGTAQARPNPARNRSVRESGGGVAAPAGVRQVATGIEQAAAASAVPQAEPSPRRAPEPVARRRNAAQRKGPTLEPDEVQRPSRVRDEAGQAPPREELWDALHDLARILDRGPAALIDALDRALSAPAIENARLSEAVVSKILALGEGPMAVKRVGDACYTAWSAVNPPDDKAALRTVRELLATWLPRRCGAGVTRRNGRDPSTIDTCHDLEIATHNALLTDAYVAREDGLTLDLETRERTGKNGTRVLWVVGRRSLPMPPALGAQIATAVQAADELADGIAAQFPDQYKDSPQGRRNFTRARLRFWRQQGRSHSPRYLAVRDIPEDVLAELKRIFPPLRLVLLTDCLTDEEAEIVQPLLDIFSG